MGHYDIIFYYTVDLYSNMYDHIHVQTQGTNTFFFKNIIAHLTQKIYKSKPCFLNYNMTITAFISKIMNRIKRNVLW